MTNLTQEFSDIANAELGPTYIKEPGVKVVTIKSYKMSEDDKDYKGKPYIEFALEDGTGAKNNVKFFRVAESDSDDAKKFKTKIIKEFLTNAEADESIIKKDKTNVKGYLQSIINKKIKVFFRIEEYLTYDKNNFLEPVIRDIVKYGWSAKVNEEIYGNQSHFKKPLNAAQMAKYEAEIEKWKRDNQPKPSAFDNLGTASQSSETEESDELPF